MPSIGGERGEVPGRAKVGDGQLGKKGFVITSRGGAHTSA